MNVLDEKRKAIATALSAVLTDGRFSAYPRPMTRAVAPAGWIEQPTGAEQTVPDGRAKQIVATFPVWFVYDGSDEAQVAGLDDTLAKAWQALVPLSQIHPRRWRPATLPVVTSQSTGEAVTIQWRAVVLDVEATILAVSFCPPPAAEPVDIPPEIVQPEE